MKPTICKECNSIVRKWHLIDRYVIMCLNEDCSEFNKVLPVVEIVKFSWVVEEKK